MQGRVKFFNDKKGYGFITGEDGRDYFVHYSNIVAEGRKTLKNDTSVSFDIKTTDKGSEAITVSAI